MGGPRKKKARKVCAGERMSVWATGKKLGGNLNRIFKVVGFDSGLAWEVDLLRGDRIGGKKLWGGEEKRSFVDVLYRRRREIFPAGDRL